MSSCTYTYKNCELAGVFQLQQCRKQEKAIKRLLYKAHLDTHRTRKLQTGFAPALSASFPCRVHDVDPHHCTPALGCSSTSLRWCRCSNKPDKPEDHSALMAELTYFVQCHTCRTKKKELCLHCFMTWHCSVFGDSKPSRGISDPLMSPRAVHMQTHTHREQLWFCCCYFIHNATQLQ